MPIQQTYTPAAIVGPVVRAVVSVGRQILRVRGLGLRTPWWMEWTATPFSVSTTWPLVITIPLDVASYFITHEARRRFNESTNPTIVAIRESIARAQRMEQYVALAFEEQTSATIDELNRFLFDTAQVGADGGIIVTVPQMWFVDP